MTRRMADVARCANVSEATVSRVFNDKPGVAEATRAAVLKALDDLGYDRPALLRDERRRLVGLVIPELQNPIFPLFAEVVAGAIATRGMTPVLCATAAGGITEPAYVEMLLQQQVAGMVFFGGVQNGDAAEPHAHLRSLHDRGVPVVIVNDTVPGLGFPSVSLDDAAAVELAFAHLRHLGHRRIGAVVGPEGHLPSDRKVAALERLTRKAGKSVSCVVSHALFSIEGGAAAARPLIDAGASAAICGSDPLALGVIKEIRRAGLQVPADFSVVGFDDSPLMACTDPPLTTIRQPIDAMGRAVLDLLVNQIEGGSSVASMLVFEPELVVRGTTGAVARGVRTA